MTKEEAKEFFYWEIPEYFIICNSGEKKTIKSRINTSSQGCISYFTSNELKKFAHEILCCVLEKNEKIELISSKNGTVRDITKKTINNIIERSRNMGESTKLKIKHYFPEKFI